jgi:capsular polysaccharide biosynthesis protein
MDLMESFRTLRRHWKLTAVLLVLALVGAVGAYAELPSTYQSTATTLLLNSKAAQAVAGNPYLSFDPALAQTADIVCLEVTDPSTALTLIDKGYTASYSAAVSSATGAPMIQITATGSNAASVQNTLQGVTNAVNAKLLQLQKSVAPENRITSQLLSSSPTATELTSKKSKPVVIVLGLGLILAFAIPQAVESVTARRKARRDLTGGFERDLTGGFEDANDNDVAARGAIGRNGQQPERGGHYYPRPDGPEMRPGPPEMRPSSGNNNDSGRHVPGMQPAPNRGDARYGNPQSDPRWQ